MTKTGPVVALSLLGLLAFAQTAEAQTKNRWRLLYEQERPKIHTHRNSLNELENYWYFTYTITNPTDEVVPILLDIMMFIETAKDLQNDTRKVDPDKTSEVIENPKQYEPLKFGRFVSNVLVPMEIEYKIIEKHSGIGNRSPGIVEESIEEFKKGFDTEPPDEFKGRWRPGDRWYLNPREMREQRFIKPGQRLMGIAIFRDVNPRARRMEVQISGLYDIFRIEEYGEEEIKLIYENRVFKKLYEFPGDEFDRERDFLFERRSEWTVKAIGPVASKTTLGNLVESLVHRLRLEEEWERDQLDDAARAKARAAENLSDLDMNVAGHVVQLATGVNFGYSSEKTVLENQAAIWRIHEWWLKHRSKLIFNEATGRFEIKDEPLPGEDRSR